MSDYYVKRTFRCLEDEQVGRIQYLFYDEKKSAASLAKEFGVSIGTIYTVLKAVPAKLISVDKVGVGRWRKRRKAA